MWLAAPESWVKSMAALTENLKLLYIPIPGPYLLRLPILRPSSQAKSEQRARRRALCII